MDQSIKNFNEIYNANMVSKVDLSKCIERLDEADPKLDKIEELEVKISMVEVEIKEVVKSQQFISKQYEYHRQTVDNLISKDTLNTNMQ